MMTKEEWEKVSDELHKIHSDFNLQIHNFDKAKFKLIKEQALWECEKLICKGIDLIQANEDILRLLGNGDVTIGSRILLTNFSSTKSFGSEMNTLLMFIRMKVNLLNNEITPGLPAAPLGRFN